MLRSLEHSALRVGLGSPLDKMRVSNRCIACRYRIRAFRHRRVPAPLRVGRWHLTGRRGDNRIPELSGPAFRHKGLRQFDHLVSGLMVGLFNGLEQSRMQHSQLFQKPILVADFDGHLGRDTTLNKNGEPCVFLIRVSHRLDLVWNAINDDAIRTGERSRKDR